MPDSADTQTSPPAAPAAPAAASDTTATTTLEARIKKLQKDVENADKGRAGAQRSEAEARRETERLSGELGTAQELLQGAQAELETTKTTADATTVSLEEAQALTAKAQRSAKVLQLAGQVQPELVTLLTGSGVQIEVPGESDEDISNALKAFAGILTKFQQPGTADTAPQVPDTPGAPASMSGAPGSPGESGGDRIALMGQLAALAGQQGQQPAMEALEAQIAALGAKQ